MNGQRSVAAGAADRPPTVVEFVGVPGVGKSTLAAGLVESLREDDVPVRTPVSDVNEVEPRSRRVPRKAAYVARYLLRRPTAAGWLRTFRRNPNASAHDVVRTGFNWLFVAGALRFRRVAGGVTVADQGLFQAYWSVVLGDPEPPADGVRRVFEAEFSEIHLVAVLVEADPDVIQRRLAARADNPSRVSVDAEADMDTASGNREDVGYSLEEAWTAYEHVTESLSALEGEYPALSVVRCGNNKVDDIGRNVIAIRDALSGNG